MKGMVVWFKNELGYGFLRNTEGVETFCHYSAIVCESYKTIKQGQTVEYDVVRGEKGMQAANVTVVK